MSLPLRSQSALEYMMTYGWAILIIVIVAVILYSMGIFNPSSSVTFTSSGFSPFTVSSSLCNNLGYKIAVLAGPIPNNANSITINKVFVTSATGANTTTAGYTLTNPVTLKSGQSTTIIIPNVACTAAKVHYSFSAKIQYSYTAGTLGLQTVNTTGTIAGTSISGKPSALTSYEPITITNSQSSATPNPFQQMINFTSSDNGWTSISTGNFGQNVEFFYYNGTIIPSWLENYTSTNAIWWLKIAAIPAGSSETVYVGFAPTTTNLFNTVNDGEAPQIPCGSTPTSSCSTYAEYDNGANVFNNYWNFAGTSMPSGFTFTSGIELTVNNGLTINSTASGQYGYYSATSYSTNIIVEENLEFTKLASLNAGDGGVGITSTSISTWGSFAINNPDVGNGVLYNGWLVYGDSGYVSSTIPLNTPVILEFAGSTSGMEFYTNSTEFYENPTAIKTPYYLVVAQAGSGAVYTIHWLRVRAYPPNGVMPSVSFGSVS